MSEQEATFINFEDGDAVELGTLPGGTEAQLRIVDAKTGTSQKGSGDFLMIRMEIVNEPYMKDISHVIMFPDGNQDDKSNNNRKLGMKQFRAAFDIASGGFNTNELIGKTAWAVLNEKDDPEYGKQNRVKNWVAGK
jgi:hypothetical protein